MDKSVLYKWKEKEVVVILISDNTECKPQSVKYEKALEC